jgi:hypothetical protein
MGARWRLPARLFNGRLRTSTLLLSLLWVALLVLYLEVRPPDVAGTGNPAGAGPGREAPPPTASAPAATSSSSTPASTTTSTRPAAPTTSTTRRTAPASSTSQTTGTSASTSTGTTAP